MSSVTHVRIKALRPQWRPAQGRSPLLSPALSHQVKGGPLKSSAEVVHLVREHLLSVTIRSFCVQVSTKMEESRLFTWLLYQSGVSIKTEPVGNFVYFCDKELAHCGAWQVWNLAVRPAAGDLPGVDDSLETEFLLLHQTSVFARKAFN